MEKKKNKTSKARRLEEFDAYVEHPRYGRHPHFTGENPQTDYGGAVFLHWHSPEETRIADTAIAADPSKQPDATVPVTHYYDVRRVCRDCHRPFIFFAREQKHWYEALGFGLDSDCVRCVPCRKKQQGLAQQRERYEALFHVKNKTPEQALEMAECGVSLMEEGAFGLKQIPQLRNLLKTVGRDDTLTEKHEALLQRLANLLAGSLP